MYPFAPASWPASSAFAAARITEDLFMPRPRKHDPELAANQPRSKNPDPHILIQSFQDQSALASARKGEKVQ
jgi:hypothetical protein